MAHQRTWQIATALLAAHAWSCSVDLLHSTRWSNACDLDPEATVCGGATTGGGGEGGESVCGDGVVGRGEECDGGPDQTVGCSAACEIQCSGPGEHLSPFVQSCYRLVASTPLAWAGAQNECETWGGSLASITSSDEQAFVIALASSRTWIGGNDKDLEGDFQWISGEEWAFEAWADEEPSNTVGEDCVELNQTLGFAWNDTACADPHDYLCERRPPGF